MMKLFARTLLVACATFGLCLLAWAADSGTAPQLGTSASDAAAASPHHPLVVLYASPASGQLLRLSALDQKARVNMWRDLLHERGDPYRIVTHPGQWDDIAPGAAIVLVSAYALSEQEKALLKKRLDGGDSLLATGNPASRDESNNPVDSKFVNTLFGPAVPPAAPAPAGEFIVVAGNTPLTYALPTGTRLWVGKDPQRQRAALMAPGAAYISDWSRHAAAGGVLAYASVGISRRVLLGWPETDWDARSKDWRTLASAALDYVEGHPIAYVETWPAPYQAAMSFGVNATWHLENLANLAKLFDEQQVKASFHLLAPDLAAHAATLRTMVQAGHDVASLGDVWRPFAGQPRGEQERRLKVAADGLHQALGRRDAFSGLRTPEAATDVNTQAAVASAGGHYLVDLGRIDSALPVLAEAGQLTLLPSTLTLDSSNAEAIQQWGQLLADERKRALQLHALSYVGLDDVNLGSDGNSRDTLRQFLAQTRQQSSIWLASAAQVSQWWQLSQRIRLQTRQEGADLLLTLLVDTDHPIAFPVAIAIVPPPGRSRIRIAEPQAGMKLETQSDASTSLVIQGLPAGSQQIRLHFDPPI